MGAPSLHTEGVRRHRPSDRPTYRDASNPERPPFTVVTVKPGFVDTAMTWGLPGMFLVAAPDQAARDIQNAVRRKRNVIYTPFFWRWIMLVIRLIPEALFKKLSI